MMNEGAFRPLVFNITNNTNIRRYFSYMCSEIFQNCLGSVTEHKILKIFAQQKKNMNFYFIFILLMMFTKNIFNLHRKQFERFFLTENMDEILKNRTNKLTRI